MCKLFFQLWVKWSFSFILTQNNVVLRECYEQEGIKLSLSDISPSFPPPFFQLIPLVKKFSSLFIRLSSFALNLFSEYLFALSWLYWPCQWPIALVSWTSGIVTLRHFCKTRIWLGKIRCYLPSWEWLLSVIGKLEEVSWTIFLSENNINLQSDSH